MQKRARLNTAKGRNCHGVITETTRTLNGSRGRVPAWVGDAAGWGLRGGGEHTGDHGLLAECARTLAFSHSTSRCLVQALQTLLVPIRLL